MKAIEIKDGKVEIVEKPDPKAKDEWVVVKILSSPMCTEYKGYKSGKSSENLGHEAAGEVVEVDQSSLVKVGDKVAVMPQSGCIVCDLCLTGDYIHCQNAPKLDQAGIYEHGSGTYAQYIIKQDWLLVPIPDEISFDYGSMACCGLGPTYGAMQRMNVTAGETILITGMGPVGLGGIVNGIHRNARVITAELDPYRRELASNIGAVLSVNPTEKSSNEQIMDLTNGVGVDCVIDCSGSANAQRFALDVIRSRGSMCFVGQGPDEVPVYTSADMIRKGISLMGIWHYRRSEASGIMQVIKDSKQQLDKHITHYMPMNEVENAFNLQLEGKAGKIILHPWED